MGRQASRPVVLLAGPDRGAMSGVSTHVNLLMASPLGEHVDLVHVQVGSEGRDEGRAGQALRLALSPFVLALAILRHRASIVHLNTSMNTRAYWRDLAYLFVSKALGARVVYQVHGGALPREFAGRSRLLAAWVRWTLRRPDVVVVLARRELAAYAEFVPHQTVVVIPNGIDVRPYTHRDLPTRVDAGSPLHLVYVGRVAEGKGLDETLEALALARDRGVEATLAIAGGGAEADRLRGHAASLGLGARVDFVGPVFGADKVALLSHADVLVLASYSEGLPYALLEAMAAGVPAIATAVGAIPDVVTDGVHGVLVPPRNAAAVADAIVRLAGDRVALAAMSRASRQRVVAEYSVERVADDLGRHYEVLAEARRTRTPQMEGG